MWHQALSSGVDSPDLPAETREKLPVSRHAAPIDHRPFQPKAKLENQQELVARYGAIAIPEVADALLHLKAEETERQQVTAKAA
jgi:hypothetical protein